ncbi:MAG: hypothetical protein NC337_03140 [Roseburia sp.]|nr:hypothetical protein [Roseburia sp.]
MDGKWMIGFLKLGTALKISDKRVLAHYDANIALLTEAAAAGGFYKSGQPVENQEDWGGIAFGAVSMKQAGCGMIATYNARVSLGENLTEKDMAALISMYERKWAVCGGKFGVVPTAPYAYFKGLGYDTDMITGAEPEDINAMGRSHDTIIMCYFNNQDSVTAGMHIVNISKDTDGYRCHNGYYKNRKTNSWSVGEAKAGLWETVRSLAGGKAKPVCTIGINRKDIRWPVKNCYI